MKVRKAVITAAGWGTRFLPLTKYLPKEMLPLLNKPLIQYAVEEAVAAGAETIIIVTAPGRTAVREYFRREPALELALKRKGEAGMVDELRRLSNIADIRYVHQKEPLGLGHAVLAAKRAVGNEAFALLLPDDLFERREAVLRQMVEIGMSYSGSVIAVQAVAGAEISRYGVIRPRKVAQRVYEVMDLVEKPSPAEAPSKLAIMGRYVLTPEIFDALKETPPGRNNEIQLTDGLKRLLKAQSVYAYEFEGSRFDSGTPLNWLKTTVALALEDPDMGPGLRDYLKGLLGPKAR